jgi:parallel beta-helix repeat protein
MQLKIPIPSKNTDSSSKTNIIRRKRFTGYLLVSLALLAVLVLVYASGITGHSLLNGSSDNETPSVPDANDSVDSGMNESFGPLNETVALNETVLENITENYTAPLPENLTAENITEQNLTVNISINETAPVNISINITNETVLVNETNLTEILENLTNETIIPLNESLNITVNETINATNQTNVTLEKANFSVEVIQGPAYVGVPVNWTKRLIVNEIGQIFASISLPVEATNVEVYGRPLETKGIGVQGVVLPITLDRNKISISKPEAMSSFDSSPITGFIVFGKNNADGWMKAFSRIFSYMMKITGFATVYPQHIFLISPGENVSVGRNLNLIYETFNDYDSCLLYLDGLKTKQDDLVIAGTNFFELRGVSSGEHLWKVECILGEDSAESGTFIFRVDEAYPGSNESFEDVTPEDNMTGEEYAQERIELNITDDINESTIYEITYQTPAPIKEEENIGLYSKRIIVSSTVHYTSIFTATAIPGEYPRENIHLYRIINGGEQEVEGIEYFDNDSDSLVDSIGWIVPSLSNETYELRIVILNVHSYPGLGENWTVMLNTTGKANLTITPIEGTAFSEFLADLNGTVDDLEFLELACGNESLKPMLQLIETNRTFHNYSLLSLNDSIAITSLFIENYTCNDTGYLTNKEINGGRHVLLFEFGGQNATAENYVSNLSCSVTTKAACTDTSVLYLSDIFNAHAELNNQSNFDYAVCCKEEYGEKVYTNCSDPKAAPILKLQNQTNAHVEEVTQSNYFYEVCLSPSANYNISCSYMSSCTGNSTCVASISSTETGHDTDLMMGNCSGAQAYTTKICCGSNMTGTAEQPTGCIVPYEGYTVMQNVTFCSGTYYLNDVGSYGVIDFGTNNVNATCNGTIFIGNGPVGFFSAVHNATISGCSISGYQYGIWYEYSENGTLYNNSVWNASTMGIQMRNSAYPSIIKTSVWNSTDGIRLDFAPYANVTGTRAYNNSGSGLIVYYSGGSNFFNNTLSNNTKGMYDFYSGDSNISNSTFYNNGYGVDIWATTGNIYYYNNFTASTTLHANANVDGNYFNTTVGAVAQGNYWDDIASLQIYDNNLDGFGEAGSQYPYNSTNGGKVSDYVTDWGPITSKQCYDNDGDGAYNTSSSPTCTGYRDCDDNNANALPPRDNLLVTSNTILCNGTFYVNDSGTSGVVIFNANSVQVSCNNTLIIGSNSGYGFYAYDYNNSKLVGCNVSNYTYGVYFAGKSGPPSSGYYQNVTDSVAYNNNYGFYLGGVYGNARNLTAYLNTKGVQLSTYNSPGYYNISYLNLYNNTDGLYVFSSAQSNASNVESYNNTNNGVVLNQYLNKNIFYNISSHDNVGSGIYYAGPSDGGSDSNITLARLYNNKVYGLYATNHYGTFRHNDMLIYNNTYDGIYLSCARENVFNNVSVVNNSGAGLRIGDTGYCGGGLSNNYVSMYNSDISNNKDSGIKILYESNSHIFTNVTVFNNTNYGIYLNSTDALTISNIAFTNVTIANSTYGMYFVNAVSNTIKNSTFYGNNYGVYLKSGTGNQFYYNNFTSSTNYHALAQVAGNYFNTTNGSSCGAQCARGNYWDNVASMKIFDSNSDNFGDSGSQYPYNSTYSSKVSVNVTDWGPITNKTCADGDGDGYGELGTNLTNCTYKQYGDCNDNNASVFPPRDDMNMTADTWLCNGTYYLNNSVSSNGIINFNAASITLTCNRTLIVGNNVGYGIFSAGYNSISIIGCNMSNYTAGVYFNNSNSSTVRNNTLVNSTYGIYILNSTGNTFYYNNIRNSTTYHAYSNSAGNHFNITSLGTPFGNYWDGVEQLKIYDTNGNGYGDAGAQYPYSSAKGGFVSTNVADYGPVTSRSDYLIQPPYPFTPIDAGTVTDSRNPSYGWTDSEHTLSDSVTYQIQVDDDFNFGSPEVDVGSITETPFETYYWTSSELQFFITYYWRVRAYDTYFTSDWSTVSDFSILPTVSCTQPTDEIEFGQMCIFPNQTRCDLRGYGSHINDTLDNHPPPYVSENNGNLKLSGKVYSDGLWTSDQAIFGPNKFYQFMLGAKESGSYEWALDSGWENMTFTLPSAKLAYYGFKWQNVSDAYNLHIRLEVPDDEPAGTKYSTTAIWCEQNESYY